MKYDFNNTIFNNLVATYPNCLENLDDIVFKDDNDMHVKQINFPNVFVLNLDIAEINRCQILACNRSRTMDLSFFVSDKTSLEIQLVELRFNYKNLSNLNRKVLDEKIIGSKNLLCNINFSFSNKFIFIFKKNLIQQARNRLNRMKPIVPSSYVIMDMIELKKEFFYPFLLRNSVFRQANNKFPIIFK
ncbi:hypothetical protein [Moraxella osloensis]|uniref:Uncharacterized protein n=1 Tax=Faucicola osloensis TaxID=34062 RepID=A0A2D2LVK0_FAUOS|nr:hypothetical protein [Moraxella osloensis]ATR79058.1 hypothetical protein NP7_07210 [Moraxella osloensis]